MDRSQSTLSSGVIGGGSHSLSGGGGGSGGSHYHHYSNSHYAYHHNHHHGGGGGTLTVTAGGGGLGHLHDATSTYIQGPSYVQSQGSYPLPAPSTIYAHMSPGNGGSGGAGVVGIGSPGGHGGGVGGSSGGGAYVSMASAPGGGVQPLHKKGSLRTGGDVYKRSRAQTSYELSQDLLDKQIEVLERKYGGVRARNAALTIQRAFRRYTLLKKFADITAMAKAEKRISRRMPNGNGASAGATGEASSLLDASATGTLDMGLSSGGGIVSASLGGEPEYSRTYEASSSSPHHDCGSPSAITGIAAVTSSTGNPSLLGNSTRMPPMRSMSLRERRTTADQLPMPRSHSGTANVCWENYASHYSYIGVAGNGGGGQTSSSGKEAHLNPGTPTMSHKTSTTAASNASGGSPGGNGGANTSCCSITSATTSGRHSASSNSSLLGGGGGGGNGAVCTSATCMNAACLAAGRKVPPEVPKRTSSISNRSMGDQPAVVVVGGSGGRQQYYPHGHHNHHHHRSNGLTRSAENGSLSSVQSSGSDSSISADRVACDFPPPGSGGGGVCATLPSSGPAAMQCTPPPCSVTAAASGAGAGTATTGVPSGNGGGGSPVWKRKGTGGSTGSTTTGSTGAVVTSTTGSSSSLVQHNNEYVEPSGAHHHHHHHHHGHTHQHSHSHAHLLDTSLGNISTNSTGSVSTGALMMVGGAGGVGGNGGSSSSVGSGSAGATGSASGTGTGLTSYKISETVRKRQYRVGLNLFNKKPDRGIAYLIRRGFVENTPGGVARFLISRKGLSKQMIGEYLGNLQSPFCMAVLECFAMELDLAGMQVDVALRKFQQHFRMPGEAQKIERLMEVFSQRYCECNVDIVARLRSPDSVFVLAFAIIMLNTDLHTPNLKPERRMRLEDFTRNLRGIDDCGDIDADMLTGIYERVRDNEFKPGSDHVTQVMKVQATIVGKKPNMALPHRRLVCYCRLYEIPDTNKKERPGVHQREVFLFNDLLVITKIFSKKKSSVTYTFRNSFPLSGMVVTLFQKPHYPFGILLSQRVDSKPLITFNARNEHDRCKFAEDLKESVSEMDEMENLRIEAELERQKSSRGTRSGTENRDSGVADVEVCSSCCQYTPSSGLGPADSADETFDQQLKRSALSNSLLDIHEQFTGEKAQRRGSVGSLDSGMSISFPSTNSASTCSRSDKLSNAAGIAAKLGHGKMSPATGATIAGTGNNSSSSLFGGAFHKKNSLTGGIGNSAAQNGGIIGASGNTVTPAVAATPGSTTKSTDV